MKIKLLTFVSSLMWAATCYSAVSVHQASIDRPNVTLSNSAEVSPTDFSVIVGKFCPSGMNLVSLKEAQEEKERICNKIDYWGIVQIAGGGKVDGRGYGCNVHPHDNSPNAVGQSLCAPEEHLIKVDAELCGGINNYSLATAEDVGRSKETLCNDTLGKWDILQLAEGKKIDGRGYGCNISDNRVPSAQSLCKITNPQNMFDHDHVAGRNKRCAGAWIVKGVCPFCIPWYTCDSTNEKPLKSHPKYEYPVQVMPYIIDLVKWRSYDPANIDGVGVLVGEAEGKLAGYQLKSNRSEYLSVGTYIYVYRDSTGLNMPHDLSQSILYYKTDESNPRDRIRHSQLGSGGAVFCAGEFKVATTGFDFTSITFVDDASGHYKPKGKWCIEGVSKKLESLGIDTSKTQVSFKDEF